MAWETRPGGRYYYRKRRNGRRVVSEYRGRGLLAELAAEVQEIANAREDDCRARAQAERAAPEPTDLMLNELETLLTGLTRAVLVANGYHTHKGTWRRSRGKSETATADPGP